MTNLTAVNSLDPVPQLETTTIALGGPGGAMNTQAQALLNRMTAVQSTLTASITAVANSVGISIVANEAQFSGITNTDPAVATPAFQNFLNACRGRSGYIPPGDYYLNATLTYDPTYPTHIYGSGYNSDTVPQGTRLHWTVVCNGLEVIYPYAQWAPGGGADAHTAYDATHGGTALGNSDNLVVFEGFAVYGPGSNLTPTTKSMQLFGVGPETQGVGCGIFAYWANNVTYKNLWVSGWPLGGLRGYWCFGTRVEGGYYVANKAFGIDFSNVNNLLTLDGVRCIGNGMVSGPYASFNCHIGVAGASSGSYPNLGVEVSGRCDFEGGGFGASAGYIFSQTAGTISSVVVAAGVATATFTSAPSFAVGDYIGVVGGTSFSSNQALNTYNPAVVLSKAGNAITFATTAANGTYAITNLVIGPYVAGLGLEYIYGGKIDAYVEGCTGPGIYIYPTNKGVDIAGSTVTNCPIYVDGYYAGNALYVVSGGTGYTAGDTLTIVGGTLATGGTAAQITVTAVSGGVITGAQYAGSGTITGKYYVPPDPTAAVTCTGGTGTGATWTVRCAAISPGGINLRGNQFYGANGGIYAQSPQGLILSGNQYVQTGSETPGLYLGWELAANAPNLKETDVPIVQGTTTGRGINQYISSTTPGHYSNYFSGYAGGLKLQDDGGIGGLGRQNTVIGSLAGVQITTGYNNTLMGWYSGNALSTGYQNTFIGSRTGDSGANLQNCTGIGFGALRNVNSGGNDVAVGLAAGQFTTANATNGSNVFIGINSARQGVGNPIGSSTFVGGAAGPFTAPSGLTNYMALGYNVQADTTYAPQSNRTVIGNSATTQTIIYGAVVTVPLTVATLPTASATLKGARSFVTDSNATMTAGIGAVVASGAPNASVPVYCDGTNWRIG